MMHDLSVFLLCSVFLVLLHYKINISYIISYYSVGLTGSSDNHPPVSINLTHVVRPDNITAC